ncbi:hypothetical protein [Natrinema sp. DC36]|uniref:hypothetical protein n=1 Tax=Natrinema sp. DC36 TaxID=2878680 RepID=UPI001CF04F0E|nr:hypothetical protein [Natrinema sp. DC36]
MTITTTDVRQWTQDEFEEIKEMLPEEADFAGISSSFNPSVEASIGRGSTLDEIERIADEIESEFWANNIPVEEIKVKAGYAGTTSSVLILDVCLEWDDE